MKKVVETTVEANRRRLAFVVSTLGRIDALRKLLTSLSEQVETGDVIVIVAQGNQVEVRALAAEFLDRANIIVTESERGSSLGRNTGVAALPPKVDYLISFPNDTSWFPAGTLVQLRDKAAPISLGCITCAEEKGAKKVLSPPGTPLTKNTVWRVFEAGMLVRRSAFTATGGFDVNIGTGASTPWQAGESIDFLLRAKERGLADNFTWLGNITIMGVPEGAGLTTAQKRQKLRAYGRGGGYIFSRWHYPLWLKLAFLAAGLLIGVRLRHTYQILDGWWSFIGRLEGLSGHLFTKATSLQAVEH